MAEKDRGEAPPNADGLPYDLVGPPPLAEHTADGPGWCDSLPPILEPSYVPLVRVRAGGKVWGYAVNQYAEVCEMHYVLGAGSVPHLKPAERCPYCREGWRVRLYGYWAVLLMPKETLAIFELTQEVLRSNRPVADRSSMLRGRAVQLERSGKGKRCRVLLTLAGRDAISEERRSRLHAPIDTRSAMERIWGLRSRQPESPLDDPDEVL